MTNYLTDDNGKMLSDILHSEPMATVMKLSSFFTVWQVDETRGFDANLQFTTVHKDIVRPAFNSWQAKSEEDFAKVFEQQVSKLEKENTEITIDIKMEHATDIINELQSTLANYKQNTERKHLTYSLIHLTNKFITWLELERKNRFKQAVSKKDNGPDQNYSLKQIAIACFLMKITLDDTEAKKALSKYSKLISIEKLLQKRVSSSKDLSAMRENKSANTKHLKDLEAVERLVSGEKNEIAVSGIKTILRAFKANADKHS